MELTAAIFAEAWALVPDAVKLVGDSGAEDQARLMNAAGELAREHAIEPEFLALTAAFVDEDVPFAPASVAAYWATRRIFGVDPRVVRELNGPTDIELHDQALELAANAEEAETERFYREDFPAIAAAQGRSPYASASLENAAIPRAAESANVAKPPEPRALDVSHRCDWSREAIADDYSRHMSFAERKLFKAVLEESSPDPEGKSSLEAVQVAMQYVIDRRVRGRWTAA